MTYINRSYQVIFSDWLERQYQYSQATKEKLSELFNRISKKINLNKLENFDEELEDYLHFISRNYAKSYQSHILWTLNSFKQSLIELDNSNQLIARLENLPSIRHKQNESHRPYSNEEIKLILKSATGLLHQIFWLALHTGMRKTEIQNLRVSDVNLDSNYIYVRRGKYNISRKIYVLDTKPLQNWLIKRKVMSVDCDYWLFSSWGRRIKGDITKMGNSLSSLSKQLDFKVTLHRCRTTYATHLYNHPQISFKTIQDQLGHLDADMTAVYIQPSLEMHKFQMAKIKDLYRLKNAAMNQLIGRSSFYHMESGSN